MAFFHQSTLHKQRRNTVKTIKRDDGSWEDNIIRVHQLFDEYFLKLFTSFGQRDWGPVLDCVTSVVTDDMNRALMMAIIKDEIIKATWQWFKSTGSEWFF